MVGSHRVEIKQQRGDEGHAWLWIPGAHTSSPGVYMVYWTEKDNTHVVHIEDYGGGVAYTNITAPNGSFTNLRGKLRLLE